MQIALIVAMAENRVIGDGPNIPWRIRGEQKQFRELTLGHCLIFGRKTYESIGKALPGRTTLVVTRRRDYSAPGCIVVHSLQEALEHCRDESIVYIGGGAELYREALPLATHIYLTTIEREYPGDVYFPKVDLTRFEEVEARRVEASVPYTRRTYVRRASGGSG